MKARHFRKLRKLTHIYDVETSHRRFGDFRMKWDRCIQVRAKNPQEACHRARRRGYGLIERIGLSSTDSIWAHWRVKLNGKSDHFKNVIYF